MNDSPFPTEPPPSPGQVVSGGDKLNSPGVVAWERAAIERLLMAQVQEQKAQRQWRNFFRLAWLLLVLSVGALLLYRAPSTTAPSSAHTAVVEIRGEIAAGADASADNIVPALRSAFEDAGAQAVVVVIDSPGGSPVQAGIINDELRRLRDKHDKPLYVVVEETCASAAYYIAAAADQIYVDKASVVGSIGVLMDGFGFTGLMDKLGVERRLMTAGANKGFLDPFSPQSEAHRAHAQKLLDHIHAQFIEVVKDGRGERLKETPDLFSGLFWSGEQAIELGLADHLGSLDYVAREVIKAEEIVDYTRRENVAERLAKRFGASVGAGFAKALGQVPVQLR